jgi:glucoamylase
MDEPHDAPEPGGEAFGAPGLSPRWTRANKDGMGTAYSADSRLWFTLFRGIVTEVYFPTIDMPQTRDLQFLVTDGESFFHEEKRALEPTVERLGPHALGFRVRSRDPEGRYSLDKEVIASPHLSAVLERVRFVPAPAWRSRLRLYVLCAPHLDGGGWHNRARTLELAGRRLLTAEKGGAALALAATVPFRRASCGFVGASDGWTDLSQHYRMDWEFGSATDGNVALTGELDVGEGADFTLALALGRRLPHATTTLLQALATPFESARHRFVEQWDRACRRLLPLGPHTSDGGRLLHSSYSILLGHEDKNYPGAFIASLSIPWGNVRGDDERGGYHLVWTRDLVHIATGLLAAGNREAPLRALVYLASRQEPDGGFAQNFWIPGDPYWTGIQLDEVSHPILLAGRLLREGALEEFDPYPMVLAAAGFLVRHGPVTQQDRWEEVGGYSPSTLAVNVAALVTAAGFARVRGDEPIAAFLEEYADYLEGHIDRWTATTEGTAVAGIRRHYVRIRPAGTDGVPPSDGANDGGIALPNQPPDLPPRYPAKEVVDAGFLELVRYGLRRADDRLVTDSVSVVDRLLRAETPFGPCWRRYNHDGYGERPDGGPFEGWGQGRAWPLLTGERGHYALAAGEDARAYARALERFATACGFLPEQVWDEADRPELHLALGRPTGSAVPLAWAHGEYLCLIRSIADGAPYERLPAVSQRYAAGSRRGHRIEVWKPNHRTDRAPAGSTLRVIAAEPFRLRWSSDGWRNVQETPSTPTRLGVAYADLSMGESPGTPMRFTLYWPARDAWEGRDYAVEPVARQAADD